MKFKFKCKQDGLYFEDGDFVTIFKEVKDKRQYFLAKGLVEHQVLTIESIKEEGFNTVKDLTKYLKAKDNDYVEKDLELIKFKVISVNGEEVIIEGEFNDLNRSVVFKASNSVGKFISSVSAYDLVQAGLENRLFDSKILLKLCSLVELHNTDSNLVKGYVSSFDGKEVTFRLDSVEENLNYYKKQEDLFDAKCGQLVSNKKRFRLLILEDLPILNKSRHLLNAGDDLLLDDELKNYLELTLTEPLNTDTEVKVASDTKYSFGKKHYLVTF